MSEVSVFHVLALSFDSDIRELAAAVVAAMPAVQHALNCRVRIEFKRASEGAGFFEAMDTEGHCAFIVGVL